MKQYLERIKSLRAPKKEEDGAFSVRFFEQNEAKRTELSSENAFGNSLDDKPDPTNIKEALMGMKDVMGTQGEKDAFDEVLGSLGGNWDEMKTTEDLERLITNMDAYNAEIDAEIEETGADLPRELLEQLDLEMPHLPSSGTLSSRTTIPQIPEKPWTINQRKKISRLNSALGRVFRETRRSNITKKNVLTIYKAYHAARLSLAHGWSNVPMEVWELLWKVFSVDESINMHRLSHVALLARDMSEAKITLAPEQQLLTIEAVFVDGWESKAIDNWKRCISTLGDEGSETFQQFWELGVRMYCRVGDLEQAQRSVNKLLDRNMDPRILVPLIRTFSELGTDDSRERAWAAYRQMRELLGSDMKLTDYDQVIAYFLTTNQTENALYAFVDMMSDGKIDLKRQKYMPSVVANKFFFGKWLKRLIGAGDLNGALSVVDFMRNRGIEAAPIQLNGLIGAWQRAGGAEDLEKADELAWGMIDSRIDFVNARRDSREKPRTKSAVASLPRATIETFSLLAENYRLRDLHERLEDLWTAFRDAEISPDAFMINQLLESYIQSSQVKEALDLYRALVTEQGVKPDPYTFSALWKTLGINRLHIVQASSYGAEASAARALFAETAKFNQVFDEGMDGQLARKILHTFRRVKDHAGLLVALTALRDIFNFLPTETLVLELLLNTTKLSWDTPSQRGRLMVAKRTLDRSLLAWAEGDADKLQGERRNEALFEHLQKHYWPTEGAADTRGIMTDVAKQMGVYDMLKKGTKKQW